MSGAAAQEEEPPPGPGDPAEPQPALPGLPIEDPGAILTPAPAAPPAVGEPEPLLLSLAPAPVLLEVLSWQAVVRAGEPFTLTVRVSPTSSDTPLPEGLAVSVRLPAGVCARRRARPRR